MVSEISVCRFQAHNHVRLQATRKRKEAILDLKKHLDHQIRVKFVGGREGMFVRKLPCLASLMQQLCSGRHTEGVRPACQHRARRCSGAFRGCVVKQNLSVTACTCHCCCTGEGDEEGTSRQLGLLVCRGTSVMLICPEEGFGEIANPFVAADDGVEE